MIAHAGPKSGDRFARVGSYLNYLYRYDRGRYEDERSRLMPKHTPSAASRRGAGRVAGGRGRGRQMSTRTIGIRAGDGSAFSALTQSLASMSVDELIRTRQAIQGMLRQNVSRLEAQLRVVKSAVR
jgi:hypothetical protein